MDNRKTVEASQNEIRQLVSYTHADQHQLAKRMNFIAKKFQEDVEETIGYFFHINYYIKQNLDKEDKTVMLINGVYRSVNLYNYIMHMVQQKSCYDFISSHNIKLINEYMIKNDDVFGFTLDGVTRVLSNNGINTLDFRSFCLKLTSINDHICESKAQIDSSGELDSKDETYISNLLFDSPWVVYMYYINLMGNKTMIKQNEIIAKYNMNKKGLTKIFKEINEI